MCDKYIYELTMKVRDYEVDAEGIVNNANYLHYLEHTRHEFCEQAGLTFRSMHEQGLDPVVSHIDIRYVRPLGLGDSMVSKLALSRRGPVFVFRRISIPRRASLLSGPWSTSYLLKTGVCHEASVWHKPSRTISDD